MSRGGKGIVGGGIGMVILVVVGMLFGIDPRVILGLAGTVETVQNMGAEYTGAFQAIYPAVAQAEDVLLIPFFLEGVGGNRELNQPDFIHPTAEGYAVVVETIYPYVVEAINQLAK